MVMVRLIVVGMCPPSQAPVTVSYLRWQALASAAVARVDPKEYPIDVDRYRSAPTDWLAELDPLTIHHGPPHQRMGVRRTIDDDWLRSDELRQGELDLKRRLINDAPTEVYAALPGSERATAETAELVAKWRLRHGLGDVARAVPEFVGEALQIQEDLCLMERDPGGRWLFTAGVVCFPTQWRLTDKIGLELDAIHGPVEHYADDLAPQMTRFFDRLQPNRIIVRRNWGFSPDPHLFLPDRISLHEPDGFEPSLMWLRSERQTLRRLPGSDAVLFTIKVQMASLDDVAYHPALARLMRESVLGWTAELAESRGFGDEWLGALTEWLRGVETAPR